MRQGARGEDISDFDLSFFITQINHPGVKTVSKITIWVGKYTFPFRKRTRLPQTLRPLFPSHLEPRRVETLAIWIQYPWLSRSEYSYFFRLSHIHSFRRRRSRPKATLPRGRGSGRRWREGKRWRQGEWEQDTGVGTGYEL